VNFTIDNNRLKNISIYAKLAVNLHKRATNPVTEEDYLLKKVLEDYKHLGFNKFEEMSLLLLWKKSREDNVEIYEVNDEFCDRIDDFTDTYYSMLRYYDKIV